MLQIFTLIVFFQADVDMTKCMESLATLEYLENKKKNTVNKNKNYCTEISKANRVKHTNICACAFIGNFVKSPWKLSPTVIRGNLILKFLQYPFLLQLFQHFPLFYIQQHTSLKYFLPFHMAFDCKMFEATALNNKQSPQHPICLCITHKGNHQ